MKSKDNILVRQLSKIAQDEGIDIEEKCRLALNLLPAANKRWLLNFSKGGDLYNVFTDSRVSCGDCFWGDQCSSHKICEHFGILDEMDEKWEIFQKEQLEDDFSKNCSDCFYETDEMYFEENHLQNQLCKIMCGLDGEF